MSYTMCMCVSIIGKKGKANYMKINLNYPSTATECFILLYLSRFKY